MYHAKPLLVLDLDETLVHSSKVKLANVELITTLDQTVYQDTYYVYKRPYLDEFLDYCFEHFDIGVWTAASEGYANKIVKLIFKQRPLVFVFTEQRCTRIFMIGNYYRETTCVTIKDLKKVTKRQFNNKRYSKHRILAIDDKEVNFKRNYGNGIRVEEWNGYSKDDELKMLILFLEYLLSIEPTEGGREASWRRIEKRYWHAQVRVQHERK